MVVVLPLLDDVGQQIQLFLDLPAFLFQSLQIVHIGVDNILDDVLLVILPLAVR